MRAVKYPFEPRSTSYLIPGQFWAIPLRSGQFGCGRVIQVAPKDLPGSSRTLLAGLMDWVGSEPPTADAIAGRRTIEQGSAHILTIRETGGAILGYRPLEGDGIEPDLFTEHHFGKYWKLLRGFEEVNLVLKDDGERLRYPVFRTWGYKVIEVLAEKHFGGTSER